MHCDSLILSLCFIFGNGEPGGVVGSSLRLFGGQPGMFNGYILHRYLAPFSVCNRSLSSLLPWEAAHIRVLLTVKRRVSQCALIIRGVQFGRPHRCWTYRFVKPELRQRHERNTGLCVSANGSCIAALLRWLPQPLAIRLAMRKTEVLMRQSNPNKDTKPSDVRRKPWQEQRRASGKGSLRRPLPKDFEEPQEENR